MFMLLCGCYVGGMLTFWGDCLAVDRDDVREWPSVPLRSYAFVGGTKSAMEW